MEKEELELTHIENLKRANISLILDSYNDIFSTFDPRPYHEKALSIDFIEECERAARDKGVEGFELLLSVPSSKRNLNDEVRIKNRLREHFHKHSIEKEHLIKKIKRNGLKYILVGSILLIVNSALHTYFEHLLSGNFLLNLISLLAEPASWFSFWEGLGKIFLDTEEKEPEKDFYKKMANAQISFRGY